MEDTGKFARLRWLAWIEGASLLVLVLIAMPLKYFADFPMAVRVVGTLHGIAFVMFGAAVADVWLSGRLPGKRALVAMLASLVPGGTFVFIRVLSDEAPPALSADQS